MHFKVSCEHTRIVTKATWLPYWFLRLVSLSVNEAFNYLHYQLLAADKLDQQHHVASGNWLIKSELEAICFTAVF